MHRRLLALTLALLALPAPASAYVPPGAQWREEYFDTPEGRLHADVLRPKGLADDVRTPVIMTISPYVSHSTQILTTGFDPTAQGPSSRFADFMEGSGLFAKGYTYVIVDLPGFGGSGGCTDWGGPNEQGAVKHAVEWAAKQPWSNGRVGTYGKSYDAWTGLMGIAQQPKGLGAVVAQEPVYSGYLYEYMNGVRYPNSLNQGISFSANNVIPGTTNDTPEYQANSLPLTPHCLATNIALQQVESAPNGFWDVRDLVPAVRGATTPLLLTQGFLEDNTRPDRAWDFFNNLAGPKRGWFGQFDHVRGNDAVGGRLAMGRAGWFAEVMRFYDRYLKDEEPAVADPPIALQYGPSGAWRSEDRWPPADSRRLVTTLRAGTYADDNANRGMGGSGGKGIWTISAPLPYDAHVSGVPQVTVDVAAAAPNANLVVDVYDIDQAGRAVLLSRGAQLVRASGLQSFDLYGQDWEIGEGHRLGVLITGSNAEWWTHVPTRQDVTVSAARIALPFLRYARTSDLPGSPSVKLGSYRGGAITVPAATIAAAESPFGLPAPLE